MISQLDTHAAGPAAGGAQLLRRRRAAVVVHLLPQLRAAALDGEPASMAPLTRLEAVRSSHGAASRGEPRPSPLALRTRFGP